MNMKLVKLKIASLATELNMPTSLHFRTRGLEKAWACDNGISLDSWKNFKRYKTQDKII